MLNWFRRKYARSLALFLSVMVVIMMSVTAFFIDRIARNYLIEELSNQLEDQARLMLTAWNEKSSPAAGSAALQKSVGPFGEACQCRITVINHQGTVIADSQVAEKELPNLENHGLRSEVRHALAGEKAHAVRYSTTLKEDLFYAAIPFKDEVGQVRGAVRLAVPLTRVKDHISRVRSTVLQWTVGLLLIALLMAWFVAQTHSRRVRDMSLVAHALLHGHFEKRLRHLGFDELGQLGETINFLAEKTEATIRDLARDKTQLMTILANMVEGVVAVDQHSHILVLNPSLCRLFNLEGGGVEGRPVVEVLRHSQLNQLVTDILLDQKERLIEIRTFGPGELIFEAHGVPLIERGELRGVLLVLHDITRLRRLEQLRREFVANVSHELRTPLTTMKGCAETLRLGAINDKANRIDFLKSIENQAEQMTRLVDDLLDLAAIESGQRVVRKISFDLTSLMKEVVQTLGPMAAAQHVSLVIGSGPDRLQISADPDQMKQVLMNLLDNAIKFNRDGGRVEIRVESHPSSIKVEVRDTGIGIPSADLPRVFERFFRVDKGRSRELGGTGLGLSIVKHIIEAHGGEVDVTSQDGQGSTFSFTLPL